MTVTKTTPMFKTSDGQEFDDEDAAQRHEEFIEAKKDYEAARQRWTRVLAESQTTADGHPFDFSMMRDYWFVTRWIGAMPSLQAVSFYIHNCDVNDNDEGSIHQLRDSGRDGTWIKYRISELYLSKTEATKALVVAQKEHIAELQFQLDNMTKKG